MCSIRSRESSEEQASLLSICIATYNRGGFIGETLESILGQMQAGVELVVVDGASPDNTHEVMAAYLERHPRIRYFRERENSGIDRDYDKAVGYARGEYCWLMTDDDLLRSGAVSRVLAAIDKTTDLVVVNSEIRNADLTKSIDANSLKLTIDREYAPEDRVNFLVNTASYLSFIGGVVIRRALWLERDRASYYGTLFIHVGVIFQRPLTNRVKIISDPLIVIRYGNAMWTSRGFEIWMFKWPALIWSLPDIPDRAKSAICSKSLFRKIKNLVLYRGIGGYGLAEYRRFMAGREHGVVRGLCLAISVFPASLVNALASLYALLARVPMASYDLSRSRHANWVSRFLARFL